MYNLEIGHRVLTLYNEREGTDLSARQFFDEVMFPDFFDLDEDYLHLMQVGNSSFFQAFAQKDRITGRTIGSHKLERHHSGVGKVVAGLQPVSGAIAVGYPASGPMKNTAGQVSNVSTPLREQDILYTWIGAACGLGVGGGYNLLIDNKDLLLYTLSGWPYYRRFLEENTTYKGRQLETWNGLWVVYGYGAASLEESYRIVKTAITQTHQGTTPKGESNLADRPDWFRFFFNLTRAGTMPPHMDAYAYKYGQMNTTLGMVGIELEPIGHFSDIFHRLVEESHPAKYNSNDELRRIFENEYKLPQMVALGGISIRTLRPAKVEAFMKSIKPQKTDDNPLYPILIKAWITAMLNNDQLADLAKELGHALRNIETNSREAAATKIMDLLTASHKTAFIQAGNALLEHKGVVDERDVQKRATLDEAVLKLKECMDAAQRHIPTDQLPLFRALAKSDYLMAKFYTNTQPTLSSN